MNDIKKIKTDLIKAGHDAKLVEHTQKTAAALQHLLDEAETPPKDTLESVFKESG